MTLLLLPLTLVWLEVLLAWKAGFADGAFLTAGAVLNALAFGFLLTVLVSLIRSDKACGWILFILCEFFTIFFTIEYYCSDAFSAYMSPASLFMGAGDIATEYGDVVLGILKGGADLIVFFQIPAIFCLHWALKKASRFPRSMDFLAYAFICVCLLWGTSVSVQNATEISNEKYTYGYTFDDGVRTFGLLSATRLELEYGAFGVPDAPAAEYVEPEPVINPEPMEETDPYAGLFAGKNLVLITAESFSKELLYDGTLFPTLARMFWNGIRVDDFYHPFWGGSTTSGETSILLGLIPTEGADSMQRIINKDNSRTAANLLRGAGYSTIAYHNGKVDYYNRNLTHPALGYTTYIAKGNGMEKYVSGDYPGSDFEMFEYTTEALLDTVSLSRDDSGSYTPFHVYYMTYSGHGLYNFNGNKIDKRHKDEVAHYTCSTRTKAYVAGNLDFEQGLAYMVRRFEEEGILDDTVFIITSDHYPYALQQGEAWGNEVDYLHELYGHYVRNYEDRDHNVLLIWTPSLEETDEQIVITEPSYTPDILPTLLYLFGIEYDSSAYVGRNLLSDEEALVIWANSSWKTSLGSYNATSGKFTPAEGVQMTSEETDAYVKRIKEKVRERVSYSRTYFAK